MTGGAARTFVAFPECCTIFSFFFFFDISNSFSSFSFFFRTLDRGLSFSIARHHDTARPRNPEAGKRRLTFFPTCLRHTNLVNAALYTLLFFLAVALSNMKTHLLHDARYSLPRDLCVLQASGSCFIQISESRDSQKRVVRLGDR